MIDEWDCNALHWKVQYFYPLLILQQWQHIFYYSTWDKSAAAKVSNFLYQFQLNYILYSILIYIMSYLRELYPGPVWTVRPSGQHVNIYIHYTLYII